MVEAVLFGVWVMLSIVAIGVALSSPTVKIKGFRDVLQVITYIIFGFHLMIFGVTLYTLGVLLVYGRREALNAVRDLI